MDKKDYNESKIKMRNPSEAFKEVFGLSDDDIRCLEQRYSESKIVSAEEKRFRELILSTKREGAEKLLKMLKLNRFFEAPASVDYHCNWRGGLVTHSLKVYDEAMKLREEMIKEKPEIENALDPDSIIICSLLHDVAKQDEYDIDRNGKPVHRHPDFIIGGHGTKSVIEVLQWGFRLLPQESCAIRWHMGGKHITDKKLKSFYDESIDAIPLCKLIVKADYNASHQ